jgi:hypothetical protein
MQISPIFLLDKLHKAANNSLSRQLISPSELIKINSKTK